MSLVSSLPHVRHTWRHVDIFQEIAFLSALDFFKHFSIRVVHNLNFQLINIQHAPIISI